MATLLYRLVKSQFLLCYYRQPTLLKWVNRTEQFPGHWNGLSEWPIAVTVGGRSS